MILIGRQNYIWTSLNVMWIWMNHILWRSGLIKWVLSHPYHWWVEVWYIFNLKIDFSIIKMKKSHQLLLFHHLILQSLSPPWTKRRVPSSLDVLQLMQIVLSPTPLIQLRVLNRFQLWLFQILLFVGMYFPLFSLSWLSSDMSPLVMHLILLLPSSKPNLSGIPP